MTSERASASGGQQEDWWVFSGSSLPWGRGILPSGYCGGARASASVSILWQNVSQEIERPCVSEPVSGSTEHPERNRERGRARCIRVLNCGATGRIAGFFVSIFRHFPLGFISPSRHHILTPYPPPHPPPPPSSSVFPSPSHPPHPSFGLPVDLAPSDWLVPSPVLAYS